MALGARRRDVLKMIVKRGMLLTIVGIAIGTLGGVALTRLMQSLLFGIDATDPGTFLVVAAALGAVSLFACYVPARRAARVDPMIALRHE